MRGEGEKRSAPLLQDFNRYPNPLWEQPGLRRRPCFEPPRRPIHGGTFNRNPRKSPGSQTLFYLINRVFFLSAVDPPGQQLARQTERFSSIGIDIADVTDVAIIDLGAVIISIICCS